MKKNNVCDMTQGNEMTLLLRFALPMLLGNLFQQLYNMVDSVIVGNYVGKNALAAVGATGSLNFFYFSLCNGYATGTGVLVAQYFGIKDEKKIKASMVNGSCLMLMMGIIMSIVSVVISKPVLVMLKTPEVIFYEALLYFRIVCSGLTGVVIYNGIAAMLRALGDSKTPLVFLMISSVLNVAGDLILVLLFDMGVAGVAFATIVSQIISAAGCIIYAMLKNSYFHVNREDLKLDKSLLVKLIKLGISFGVQSGLIGLSCIALQGVINQFGENVIAAYTATSRMEQLVQQPFSSLGMAVATFTAQNLGAKKIRRVQAGYYKASFLTVMYGTVMFLLMFICGDNLVRLFVNDGSVVEIGSRAIRITALFYIPLGMSFIARSLVNGAGDSVFAFVSGMTEVVGRVGFSIILAMIPALGYWSVWYTTGMTWLITAIVCMLRYAQAKWKRISLVK